MYLCICRAIRERDVDAAVRAGACRPVVTKETVVVRYDSGSRDEVKVGTAITVFAATKQADGTLLTPRISYGRDGLIPPI